MPSIAFLHGSNDLYGASRVLLQDVAVLVGEGWKVGVALPTPGPLTERLAALGANVSVEPLAVLRKVASPLALRPPHRLPTIASDADVVVVWTLALASYLPLLAARRKLAITSVHEILEGRLGAVLARGAGRFSGALMTNSQTTSEWLFDNGVRSDKTFLAFPEAPAFDPLPPAETQAPQFNALLAGRVNGHKGHLEAVAAGRLVREAGIDLRLTLLGGSYPGQEEHMARLLEAIEGEPWVHFGGEVPDVRPFLAAANAMLVPTTQPEPFGVVALEAWAAGRRVIASDEGGLAEATRLVDGVSFASRDIPGLAAAIELVARSDELRAGPSQFAEAHTACTAERRAAAWRAALARAERGRGLRPTVGRRTV